MKTNRLLSYPMNEDSLNEAKCRNKKGIIYLSTLPKLINVLKLREIMSQFGKVGRIYLQPQQSNKKKPVKRFCEGWIEFEKKRVAKSVARGLNGRKIECKKSSHLYDFLWNIKYLSKFKWIHLSERVAYERAVRKHRMRVEIAQAKKEANEFSMRINNKKKDNEHGLISTITSTLPFPQRRTESQVKSKRKETQNDSYNVLERLFV